MVPRRRLWLLIRLCVYILAAALLFQSRRSVDWKGLFFRSPTLGDADSTLSIAGAALAPGLIHRLLAFHGRENPHLKSTLAGGGSNQALEAVANRRTDVAFTLRAPAADEQARIRAHAGDSLLCFPVATGGLILLAGLEDQPAAVSMDDLRRFLTGAGGVAFDRLHAPDPNSGLWDALLKALGLPPETPPAPGRVVFLEDEPAVRRSVLGDPGGVGLASTFTFEAGSGPGHPRVVPVRSDAHSGRSVLPTDGSVADGTYPLFNHLFVCCRAHGSPEGAAFVTHLTGARGQQQVERAGFLPARRFPREVILSTRPIGDTP